MGNPYRDIRPADYRERVKRYRKSVPPDLLNSTSVLQARGTQRRPLSTGLDEYTGTFGEAEAAHLLKRTLFGVKKSELREFSALTLEQAVDALVTDSPTPAPPVNNYNDLNDFPDPDVPQGESWVEAPFDDALEGGRVISMKSWIVKNMVNQEATLHEKMTFFWHNLLAIQFFDVFVGKGVYQYYDMLRRNAFGNYKTLVRDLTLDPAMLLFLNGTFNNKEQPDENFARELQELFTVGKGSGSKYTEADVGAAARVLTGWVINFNQAEQDGPVGSFFWPDGHETSDKQFSSFYGNKVISGKSGLSGAQELDELLTMIFDTQEAAKYICRRLYNFFVYPEIDETTETNIIEPLAAVFRDADYEIKPVLKKLFKSEHFFDAANRGAMIKSPADFLLGIWRSLEHHNPYASDVVLDAQYYLLPLWTMGNQGQEIGDPPSVAGWPAYYQAPQFDKSWITTDTIVKRAQETDGLVWWGSWINEDFYAATDLFPFVEGLDAPDDPNALLAEVTRLLLGIDLDQASLDQLKLTLLSGQQGDYIWTDAWNAYQADPSESNRSVLDNRLKSTLQSILQLGEAQLM